ncbi:unnamed protein product [Diplocarpon coronariae]
MTAIIETMQRQLAICPERRSCDCKQTDAAKALAWCQVDSLQEHKLRPTTYVKECSARHAEVWKSHRARNTGQQTQQLPNEYSWVSGGRLLAAVEEENGQDMACRVHVSGRKVLPRSASISLHPWVNDVLELLRNATVCYTEALVGYWILDTGYWILDTGYWILDTGYWILDTGYWILDTGHWILDTQ